MVFASLGGALVGTALLAIGRHQKDAPLAFGPYLAAAGWLSLMWGDDIVHAYLGWAG